VYAVPYAEPSSVRAALDEDGVDSHQTAMDACVARIRAAHPASERSVLVGHTFVTGGAESKSERPLAVGGVASVNAASFEEFSYVALGHLHRPQALGGSRVRYSGSILKYSFDEASHCKGVHMVEMGADGAVVVEEIPLVPRHDVREVRGLLADLLRDPVGPVDDYLAFVLDDAGPIVDATGQLRAVYPNVLDQRRAVSQAPQRAPRSGGDYRTVREEEVFPRFFVDVTDVEISMPQLGAFTRTLERMRTEEREVVA
jgi:exonuclease SbcD